MPFGWTVIGDGMEEGTTGWTEDMRVPAVVTCTHRVVGNAIAAGGIGWTVIGAGVDFSSMAYFGSVAFVPKENVNLHSEITQFLWSFPLLQF